MDRTHRRTRAGSLGGFALLVPTSLLLASCSSGSSSSAPAASSTPTTVHYYSVSKSMSMFSASGSPVTDPNAQPTPGDYIDETGTDYSGNHSSHSSSVAATDHLACTFTTVTAAGATAICQGQFAIGNSMLLAQHVPISFTQTSGPVTVNLTGGSGQYQGVHGTVSGAQVPNSDNTDFTITFSK